MCSTWCEVLHLHVMSPKPRKITKLQAEKLQGFGIPPPETSEEAKKLIEAHLLEVARNEPVTPRQAAFIREFGEDVPATKIEASALLDRLTKGPSPKQKAKLAYLKIDWPTTKEEAGEALDEIQGDPLYRDDLKAWDLEKYDLHPDLYDEDNRTGEQIMEADQIKKKRDWEAKGLKQQIRDSGCGLLLIGFFLVVLALILKAVF